MTLQQLQFSLNEVLIGTTIEMLNRLLQPINLMCNDEKYLKELMLANCGGFSQKKHHLAQQDRIIPFFHLKYIR